MSEKVTVKSLYRVGIVVRDAEAKFKMFEKYLGADRSTVEITDTLAPGTRFKNLTMDGEPLTFHTKFLIFPLSNIEIELIQPLDDKGPYAKFLAEHGEGVQHFNIELDDQDKFHRIMEEISAADVTSGQLENTSYRYFDTREAFGVILETCRRKPFEEA